MTKIELARSVAAYYHSGQMYGDKAYTYHLDSVEESVRNSESQLDIDSLLIIAQLHDILEDTSCTLGALQTLFGFNVTFSVIALTFRFYDNKETRSEHIERVKKDAYALEVKKHDTLCNLAESKLIKDEKRIKRYTDQYSKLVN